MTTNNVAALAGGTSQTIKDVIAWISMMSERGVYQLNTARVRISAVENLISALGPEEPREAQWVLDHLHEIARRWATLNSSKPETTNTYESRARGALEDYLQFVKDPTTFKPRRKEVTATAAPKKGAKRNEEEEVPPVTAGSAPNPYRSFPVAQGEFLYQLPPNGVSSKDVFKIMCHLLTFAEDFDPTNTVQARVFALATGDEK